MQSHLPIGEGSLILDEVKVWETLLTLMVTGRGEVALEYGIKDSLGMLCLMMKWPLYVMFTQDSMS